MRLVVVNFPYLQVEPFRYFRYPERAQHDQFPDPLRVLESIEAAKVAAEGVASKDECLVEADAAAPSLEPADKVLIDLHRVLQVKGGSAAGPHADDVDHV